MQKVVDRHDSSAFLGRTRFILKGGMLALFFAAIPGHASAATFQVRNTADSGPNSLRQAITAANATAAPDVITFNIPGTGVHTISPASPLPVITSPVTINGYSQPGASANTLATGDNAVLLVELNGASAGSGAIGLQITGGSSVVRGLVINRFSGSAIQLGQSNDGGNVIQGNFIGTNAAGNAPRPNDKAIFLFASPGNQIGGTAPAARNLISGNTSYGIVTFITSQNVIQGNYFGTDRAGTAIVSDPAGTFSIGIHLAAGCDNNFVGGTAPGARNVISGQTGYAVFMGGTVGNVVEGNYIGTDVTGDRALGTGLNQNTTCAVCIFGNRNPFGTGGGPATDNRIGGDAAGAGNVIAGYQGAQSAIFLGGSSAGDSRRANSNIVQGNFIGTNHDGTKALPNRGNGVFVQDGDDNLIGGTTAGTANIIVNCKVGGPGSGSGVVVGNGLRNQILGNVIHDNEGLGIDLGGNGATLNDDADADSGSNDLQNFPVLTSVTTGAGTARIKGRLNSTPATDFRIEFFGNRAPDSSGHGEGEVLLGFSNVTTDGAGNATFDVSLPISAGLSSFSATATDASGDTSEFSAAYSVRLLNISTRMRVLNGDSVLIAGFIVTGSDPKRIIIRGLGPSLSGSVSSDTLIDPVLELHQPGVFPTTNDNWRDTQQAEIQATGIPPGNNLESAIIATLDPGAYTAILREQNGVPGVGLVEVYDLGAEAGSELANISTRGFVDTGDDVMIGGFIAGPAEIGGTRVVVRALGPSLKDVANPLQDPTLQLFDQQGAVIQANDNWKSDQRVALETIGLQPTENAESALIATLPAGNYTAIVRGKQKTTGVGLVEAYNIH